MVFHRRQVPTRSIDGAIRTPDFAASARRGARLPALGVLVLSLLEMQPTPARAADIDVSIASERTVGYFLGDPIRHHVEIVAPAGARFSASTLPQPRKVSYWLDLVAATPGMHERDGRTVLTLDLTYQDFYAPIEARQQLIPAFHVGIVDASGATTSVKVPVWRFTMSPLRELTAVGAATEGSPIELAPPRAPQPPSSRPERMRFALSLAAAAMLGLGLARHYGRFPFHARAARPFAAARRAVAKALGRGDGAGAFTALHRGLDATAGKRLLAEDLDAFVAAEPHFVSVRADLGAFFAASHRLFYGSDPAGAHAILPDRALLALAGTLAMVERTR